SKDHRKIKVIRELLLKHRAHRNSPLFAAGDVINPPDLVRKLDTQADSLSRFLLGRFSAQAWQLLTDRSSTIEQQKSTLVEELNKVLKGGLVYDVQRFDGIKLSKETLKLKSQNP